MIKPLGSTIEKYTNVVVVDRGHHLEHMVDFVNDTVANKNALNYTQEFYAEVDEEVAAQKKVIHYSYFLIGKYKELVKTRWFLKVTRAIYNSAHSYSRTPYPEFGEELTVVDIETLLTGVLSYFVQRISPNAFEELFENSDLNFNKMSIDTTKIWGNDLSFVGEAYDTFVEDIKGAEVDQFAAFIQLLLFVFDCENSPDLLFPLLKGPRTFLEAMEKFINQFSEGFDYYKDIQLTEPNSQEYQRGYAATLQYMSKIATALKENPDGLIVLNTNPGTLCKYEGRTKLGCARHCTRHSNADFDRDFLTMIELFLEENPDQVKFFRIQRDGNLITEIAFPVKMLANEKFRVFIKSHAADPEDYNDTDLDDEYEYDPDDEF